jgi:hypothetical protein
MNPVSTVISTVTLALQLVNAVEPDIAQIIALFKNTAETLDQYLADADATENADITKAKGEQQ